MQWSPAGMYLYSKGYMKELMLGVCFARLSSLRSTASGLFHVEVFWGDAQGNWLLRHSMGCSALIVVFLEVISMTYATIFGSEKLLANE
uniref:Uncharacterized protein n=1 Tax=Anguilla anguilla TaxID=7936 RepID=A0A0E9XJ10_ANGAN